MSADTGPNVPPFPSSYRASGLLLHVTSLPSRFGIGDVGRVAITWINQVSEAGQSGWQALPLGPTAALAIAPLQDLLNLGAEARMNVPGRAEENWSWHCTEELLSTADFHWLRDLTRTSNRLDILPNRVTEMAAHAV
jgi:4-alpha-glucanotransferase